MQPRRFMSRFGGEELEQRLLLTGSGDVSGEPESNWVITAIGDSIGSGLSPADAANKGLEPRASYRPVLWELIQTSFVDPPNVEFVGSTDYNPPELPAEAIRHSSHRGFTTYSFFPHPNPNIGSDPQGAVNNNVWDADGWATFQADIALVLLGANDVFEGRLISSIERDLRRIATELREDNPNVEILYGTIPPIAPEFPNYEDVPAVNEMIRSLDEPDGEWTGSTEASPIHIVDHYNGQPGQPAYELSIHSNDGVHPNAYGDALLAANWWNVMLPIMSQSQAPPSPEVTIEVATPRVVESPEAQAVYTVSRTGDLNSNLIVDLEVSGTATLGSDYLISPVSIEIPTNQASAQLIIPISNDDLDEPNETIVVDIVEGDTYRLGDISSATATIVDDDLPFVSVAAAAAAVKEPGAETDFVFKREGDLSQALAVKFSVSGSADAGADYRQLPTQVEFPRGVATVSLPLQPIDDKLFEADETVVIRLLSDPSYAMSSSSSLADNAVVSIIDDEEPPQDLPTVSLKALNPKVDEGASVDGFKVSRHGDTSEDLTVYLRVAGTAEAGKDYVALPKQIKIPAGSKNAILRIETEQDRIDEPRESVVVTLVQNDQYGIRPDRQAALNIIDNDLPLISIKALTPELVEGESAPGFEVIRQGDTSVDLVVEVLFGGTAKAGKDYKSISRNVKIPAGQDSAIIHVATKDDSQREPVETIVVSLKERKRYELTGLRRAVLKIIDNDLPNVSITAQPREVSEAKGSVRFVVKREGDLSEPLVVKYGIHGTATNGTDYRRIADTVEIPVGEDEAFIDIAVMDDRLDEADETIVLRLKDAGQYDLDESRHTKLVTIVDNDPADKSAINAADVFADSDFVQALKDRIAGFFDSVIFRIGDGDDGDDNGNGDNGRDD